MGIAPDEALKNTRTPPRQPPRNPLG
ncbi:hypothetical protein EMIT0357P_70097 [Pseudomonas marginalis]